MGQTEHEESRTVGSEACGRAWAAHGSMWGGYGGSPGRR